MSTLSQPTQDPSSTEVPAEEMSAQACVLCVDDDPMMLEILCDIVAQSGCVARAASSVDEAFAALNADGERRICLVLSDFNLGGKNGLDLRAAAYELRPELDFCIISGSITKEMAQRALELRVGWFFEKPFAEPEVNKVIASCRDAWSGRRAKEAETRLVHFIHLGEIADDLAQMLHSFRAAPQRLDLLQVGTQMIHSANYHLQQLNFVALFQLSTRASAVAKAACASALSGEPLDGACALASAEVFQHLAMLFSACKHQPVTKQLDLTGLEKATAALEQISAETSKRAIANQGKAHKSEANVESQGAAVKVPFKVLDEFMEKAGELTVLRNMVKKLVRSLEHRYPGDETLNTLMEMLDELHKTTSGMQQQISELRLVPLSDSWKSLTRTVRDLSQKLSKEVDVEFSGGDLRIDNSIARILSDSLVHLVRNAVDHGIEGPAERVAAKKRARGVIRLEAARSESGICLKILDDGRGMDRKRIADRALQKNLRTEAELSAMSRDDVLCLIFEPGFSTAEVVSDVSGRGVGMDFVRSAVLAVRGSIHIDSETGRGSSMTLNLPEPKSVRLIAALLVEECGHTFALPQDYIQRLYHLEGEKLASLVEAVADTEILHTESGSVPIISLRKALDLKEPAVPKEQPTDSAIGRRFVLLNTDNNLFALEMDVILDGEEVVVKPIPLQRKRAGVFGGATFVGVGGLCLILDPDGLARHVGVGTRSVRRGVAAEISKGDNTDNFLLCLTRAGTPVALSVQDVERIEVVPTHAIQARRERLFTTYQGHVQHVLDSALLEAHMTAKPSRSSLVQRLKEKAESEVDADPLNATLLAVRHGNELALLRIGRVLDSSRGATIIPQDNAGGAVKGHVVSGERLFSILDLPELLRKDGHFASLPEPVLAASPAALELVPDAAPFVEDDGIIWV